MLFLVVDDDSLSRELLTLLLEAEGYGAETAVSGEAAVARIACSVRPAADRPPLPDVILTDIQMPGLAGAPLAAALRVQLESRAVTSDTLLLAMSGSQPAASALTGFDGFLLKPFQVGDLRLAIQRRPASEAAGPVEDAGGPAKTIVPAAEASSEELPAALDEDIYAKMQDLMPTAQLGQMYALCIDDARRRIARMETLVALCDDAEYRKEAHAVKGGAGMIGASELYALSAAAERNGLSPRGKSAGTSGVTAALARLSLACDRLERILQERTQGQERTQD